jgi:sugar (pentulose or hexulose) kinase
MTRVAVIDIGKTNSKVALVDLDGPTEIDVVRRPNHVLRDGPYPHLDVEGTWEFIVDGLGRLAEQHGFDAISITTHGATAALIGNGDDLAFPVLDYEFDGPDTLRAEYDRLRPPFDETGSPALPIGLNLGAQIFWQNRKFPEAFARTRAILTYPQFWAWRLCGVMASEVTSLGCHTDLWNPHRGDFSSMVEQVGWRKLFPPVRPANDRLGSLLPLVAKRIGVSEAIPVHCGIHDSNASLLPHLFARKPPLTVVSTGTWVVCMTVGGRVVRLDPTRDTLINVDAFGRAVPSARFMGGREFEILIGGNDQNWSENVIDTVLEDGIMLLPSVQQGSGPFPNRQSRWIGAEPRNGRRFVAASFYAAMMTATCLDLIGASGDIVVEGPFASNGPYLDMLAAATGRGIIAETGSTTGTSLGAAMLAGAPIRPSASAVREPSSRTDALREYARLWKSRIA